MPFEIKNCQCASSSGVRTANFSVVFSIHIDIMLIYSPYEKQNDSSTEWSSFQNLVQLHLWLLCVFINCITQRAVGLCFKAMNYPYKVKALLY